MTTRQINNEVHSPAWGTYLMNFPLGGWVGLCFDLLTIRYIFHITRLSLITCHLSHEFFAEEMQNNLLTSLQTEKFIALVFSMTFLPIFPWIRP